MNTSSTNHKMGGKGVLLRNQAASPLGGSKSGQPTVDDAIGMADLFAMLREIKEQQRGKKEFYRVEEAADILGRKPYTIRRWIKRGRLTATRVFGTGPKGRLLVTGESIASVVSNSQAALTGEGG